MRKPDNTIVFGSQGVAPAPPSARFPEPASPPASVRMRPLSEDLIDDRAYMTRPERGLAFAAISLALIGVAAAGTYFFVGSREPTVSTTSTTGAEIVKPEYPKDTVAAPPAPAATPSDQPWDAPEVDAVRDPRIHKAHLAKEIASPQLLPTERPQAANQAPPAPATKIQPAAKPVQTAKRVPSNPPAGMSDEALERAGYYGNLTPKAPEGNVPAEPKAPSAASTEEPKSFTPEIKE